MWNLKLEIIDTHRCFVPADSQFCQYVALYFAPLTLKTSKSLVIRYMIPFLYSLCRLLKT